MKLMDKMADRFFECCKSPDEPLGWLSWWVIIGSVLYFGYQLGHAIVFSPALREVIK